MRKTRFSAAAAAMAAVAALALTSCGGSDSEAGDGGGSDSDKVRIGIKYDQPGLGYKDGENYTVAFPGAYTKERHAYNINR